MVRYLKSSECRSLLCVISVCSVSLWVKLEQKNSPQRHGENGGYTGKIIQKASRKKFEN